MTKNQIDYQRLLMDKEHNAAVRAETHRANVAQETLTDRRDRVSLDLRGRELAETTRHNVTGETETNRANLAREAETIRHNRAQEGIGWGNIQLGYANLAETTRSNQAREAETSRHNMVSEIETGRHNVRSEEEAALSRWSQYYQNAAKIDILQQEADTRRMDAHTRQKAQDAQSKRWTFQSVNELLNTGIDIGKLMFADK